MLNKIWFWMLLLGLLYAFAKGARNTYFPPDDAAPAAVEAEEADQPDRRDLQQMGQDLNAAALDAAELSVTICIGLIGIMALWLGLLNIAKEAGLVDALARLLQPLMRWLFPEVPDGHPAQGAMLMNISANILGLDNAATPLGLKAMQELQTLNAHKDTASNAMAMFLAINTSNITVVPFAIIGYRQIAGSQSPAWPLAGILITTTITSIVAIVAAKTLAKRPAYALPLVDATQDSESELEQQ